MSRRTRTRTRNKDAEVLATVKDVAAQVEYNSITPKELTKFVPKTKNQKTAMQYLREGRQIVVLSGAYGTGKSMLAAAFAAEQLRNKKVEKIYLVRPNVSTGKSLGATTGSIDEKLAWYFAQTFRHLEKFLGKGYLKYCLDKKIIEMQAVEFLRGSSFEKCVIIVEECQNFTKEDFEMIFTRISEETTMILTGDHRQSDLRSQSGLKSTVELINTMIEKQPIYMTDEDLDNLEYKIGIVEFTVDDILRLGLVKTLFKMYHHDEL